MSAKTTHLALLAAAVACALGFALQANADQNKVVFPPIDDLTDYTTVERGITVEHMLTSGEALAALKAGKPVPTGTQVVLVDYQRGVLTRYLVAQKVGDGSDEWEYQWFWPNKTIKADERVDQCYACHRSREGNQFMFTHDDAVGFGG